MKKNQCQQEVFSLEPSAYMGNALSPWQSKKKKKKPVRQIFISKIKIKKKKDDYVRKYKAPLSEV